jgi:hypothetical protein
MFLKTKKIIAGVILLMLLILTACGMTNTTSDPNLKITEIAKTVNVELTRIIALTPSPAATISPTINPTKTLNQTSTPGNVATPTLNQNSTLAASPTQTQKALSTSSANDNSTFITDVTYPDNTTVSPSTTFVKTWAIQNTGTTTWTKDYKLIYLEGLTGSNNTTSVNLDRSVLPGEQINISVSFTAPSTSGTYASFWKMYTASGYTFGQVVNLKVIVGQ